MILLVKIGGQNMKAERLQTNELKKLFENTLGVVFRTLPDTGGITHKKPYDFYMIVTGQHISVEAKCSNGKLQDHQKAALTADAAAGGKSYVLRYGVESMTFYLWQDDKEIECINTRFRSLKLPGAPSVLARMLANGGV